MTEHRYDSSRVERRAIQTGSRAKLDHRAGDASWPDEGSFRVALAAVTFGLAYAVYSEWLNVAVRESWAYSQRMPVVPPLDTGLSPLLQWLLLPALGLSWAGLEPRRRAHLTAK